MSAITVLLAVIAIGGLVYAVGVEESKSAATTAGRGARRAASSGWTAGIAGVGIGIEVGYQIIQAIAADPFAATTAVAGLFGALGIEGLLGDISGIQFLLIGVTVFVAAYAFDRRRRM